MELWKAFLRANGSLEAPLPSHWPASENDAWIIPCTHLSPIVFSGDDALSFLQGQLTNDIDALDTNALQLNGYCTPKGRLLALFWLFRRADSIIALTSAEIAADVARRLQMYVLRAKVTIERESEFVVAGIAGTGAHQVLSMAGLKAPSDPNSVCSNNEASVAKLPGTQSRYLLTSSAQQMTDLWPALTGTGTVGPPALWQWLDLLDGLPSIHAATKESFLPQSLNLDLLDGVNFKKGCYPGQEIVARVRYLGRIKERMARFHLDGPAAPEPGDALVSLSDSGRGIGTVVDAQPAPGGGVDLLAVVKTGVLDRWQAPAPGQPGVETDLHLSAGEQKLILSSQPYTLDAEA